MGNAALCVQNFGSQMVERHNKPEVEAKDFLDPEGKMTMSSRELINHPVVIARNEPKIIGEDNIPRQEKVLIESSVNSVRMSIAVKQADELEQVLVRRFMRFLMQRAEHFIVLRRVAMPGYDISFLITNTHVEDMYKHKVVDFIIQFMRDVDKEISESKIGISARARIVASTFLKTMT